MSERCSTRLLEKLALARPPFRALRRTCFPLVVFAAGLGVACSDGANAVSDAGVHRDASPDARADASAAPSLTSTVAPSSDASSGAPLDASLDSSVRDARADDAQSPAEDAESDSSVDAGEGPDGDVRDGSPQEPPDAERDAGQPPAPDVGPPEPVVLDGGLCSFSVLAKLSDSVRTVGIVNWTTSLEGLDSATVEFGRAGQVEWSAPVDVAAITPSGYRTVLLGMKANTDYDFRIVASSGDITCTSPYQSLRTGALPALGLPRLRVSGNGGSRGFIISSAGMSTRVTQMYIFDTDGDIVWWAPAPRNTTRARIDWEGRYMWGMALNLNGGVGAVTRASLDGTDIDYEVAGLGDAHHDLTVLPGGKIAYIAFNDPARPETCDTLIEYDPATRRKERLVGSFSELYNPGKDFDGFPACHANSVLYHPSDDTFTISDRNPNLYVKMTHEGELLWQLGGKDPVDPGKFFAGSGLTWKVNHGHHLLEDGRFLFFNNEEGDASRLMAFQLDEESLTATPLWQMSDNQTNSSVLGDAQWLANGNVLMTYSVPGIIREIQPNGTVVRQFRTEAEGFGYAEFRESLYGAPPR